jgi:hypothetical protein
LLFHHSSRVLLLGRAVRQASWREVRPRVAIRRRDVPRHGLDQAAQ